MSDIESFDLLEYIQSRCRVSRRYGRGEHLLAECPRCGAKDHCSVNPAKHSWRCYKCEFQGHDVIRFVSEVEGVDYSGAREIVFASKLVQRRPGELDEMLRGRERRPAKPVVDWRSAMPPEYIPCYDRTKGRWNGIPVYLSERGIERETIITYRLGWCDSGRYAHRIIIPIMTGDLVAFQARATWDGAKVKYDSPPGAPLGKMLMGYDALRPGEEVWIVEGPFDKLACHQAGIPAVPLIGKELSDDQAALIVRLKPPAVHVMLDADAEAAARRVAAKLRYDVPTDLVLLAGGDPADTGQALREQAREFCAPSRSRLAAVLAKIRGNPGRYDNL